MPIPPRAAPCLLAGLACLAVATSGCALVGYDPRAGGADGGRSDTSTGAPDAAATRLARLDGGDASTGSVFADGGWPGLDGGGGQLVPDPPDDGKPNNSSDAASAGGDSGQAPGSDGSLPTNDAGGGDAGSLDAGSADAAAGDAGQSDGGAGDAGSADAGGDGGGGDAAVGCPGSENPCGGCASLPVSPGTACGTCGLGVYACEGQDTVVCSGADTPASAPAGGVLVDDFEDGDAVANVAGGINGSWYTTADSSDGTIAPAPDEPFVPTGAGQGGSAASARIMGSGFSEWGAAFALTLNAHDCNYDASDVTGIRFHARGSGTVLLQVATTGTTPVDVGGNCLVGCNDHYQWSPPLTVFWQLYQVPFSAFAQEGWGTAVPFNRSTLRYLQFVFPADQTFDLQVDNIALY